MSSFCDQAPDPRSHIKTLTRIGYTLNSAVSDVIDNSVAANARCIRISALPGMQNPQISISDDGLGMSRGELIENMRIGCKDPSDVRDEGDLGRFGSGMKTASFSQARQLTVISKKKGDKATAARWDLDRIETSNSWSLEVFDDSEVENIQGFKPENLGESGTQIIWGKLTCLEAGSHAQDPDLLLASKLAELRSYIALHFHRFMTGSGKRRFRLNDTDIAPIDPFMTSENGYQEGRSSSMRCKGGHIRIRTHVLPHFKNMSAKSLADLGGADAITQNQGLYIYRERRLISAGGWLGISRSSQLGALARIQVDIPSSLDNDWSTDVKKASIQVPSRVRSQLKKFLSDPVKRSRKVHQYRGSLEVANRYWKICENKQTKTITYQIDPDNNQLGSIIKNSSPEDRKLLVEYLKQLAGNLPIHHIYEKMSERPKDIQQDQIDAAALEAMVNKVFGAT